MQIIIVVLSFILIIVPIIFATYTFATSSKNKNAKTNSVKVIASFVVSAIGLLSIIIFPASIHQINTGEIAVVKVWGEAQYTKTAGIHFDNWIAKTYEIYDLKTQEITQDINAYSLDAQTMECTITVQYRIQADNAILINEKYGNLTVLNERITAIAIEQAKVVLSSESAMNIIENRDTLGTRFETALNKKIAPYYVDISLCVVTNIDFSDAFEKTVEDKMIAEQEKLKAEYEKEKAIIQANQELEVAKLQAQADLAKAEGQANALKEIANAEALATKAKSIETARMLGFDIDETTTEDGIDYNINFEGKTAEEIKLIADYLKYIEYLSTWNGELPSVMTSESASILIPVDPTK